MTGRRTAAGSCQRPISLQLCCGTKMVHNGAMRERHNVRQSVTLPAKVARQVRSLARKHRLSANRVVVELLEEGLEARKRKEKAFHDLAERYRSAIDPNEVERLGEQLGRMVFGA